MGVGGGLQTLPSLSSETSGAGDESSGEQLLEELSDILNLFFGNVGVRLNSKNKIFHFDFYSPSKVLSSIRE